MLCLLPTNNVKTKWEVFNSLWANIVIRDDIVNHPWHLLQANVVMAQILFDLVVGEFQQMAKAKDNRRDRFQTYIDKTYNKTASLLANAAKAVALLAENSKSIKNGSRVGGRISEEAFNYGRNTGIAFQLIDDWLDFSASAEMLGKPAAADMK